MEEILLIIEQSQLVEILRYLSIPLISGLVGWGTNVMAVKMTFYPLEYVGIPPFGWQGIIPSKAKKMAEKSVDLLTIKLVKIDEQFALLEPHRIAEEINEPLQELSRKILNEVMDAQVPNIWRRTPDAVKNIMYNKVAEDLPVVVEEMMKDMSIHIKELLNLKTMAVGTLMQDKTLVNQIFWKCGKDEFKFIEKSGFYFGFLFGIIQMIVWYFFSPWWLLPLFGLLVGYATNWIALYWIFRPLNPIKVGPWKIHGLFFKRQEEVSREYSEIVTDKILTTRNMFDTILHGPGSKKLSDIVGGHIEKIIEVAAGSGKAVINWVAGPRQLEIIKNIASFRFMQELPLTLQSTYNYVEEALNMKEMLRDKMANLSYEEFEGFLRPAFQEDELTLIIVGAVLGCMAGFLQYFLLFY